MLGSPPSAWSCRHAVDRQTSPASLLQAALAITLALTISLRDPQLHIGTEQLCRTRLAVFADLLSGPYKPRLRKRQQCSICHRATSKSMRVSETSTARQGTAGLAGARSARLHGPCFVWAGSPLLPFGPTCRTQGRLQLCWTCNPPLKRRRASLTLSGEMLLREPLGQGSLNHWDEALVYVDSRASCISPTVDDHR